MMLKEYLKEMTSFYDNGNGDKGVYVITLPTRADNVEEFLTTLETGRMMHAIDKATLTHDKLKSIGAIDKNDNNIVMGRAACHLSHTAALIDFADSGKEGFVTVFEDDLESIDASHRKRMEIFMKRVEELAPKKKPVIAYMGYCREDPSAKDDPIEPGILNMKRPFCRHAYAVNKKGAKVLIEGGFPQVENGDVMWAKLIDEGKIYAMGVDPPIFFQNREGVPSTISPIGNSPLFETLDWKPSGKSKRITLSENQIAKASPITIAICVAILFLLMLVVLWRYKRKNH